ncbi:hypothetical protein DUI87_21979 [Hirundo rustica rustica]|uniref:Ig-like domain-containing protein n=1 Tax=Hirundo rustica rustica TaxID=333673 RepID=A0A3M0JKC7_HIRRU|nr:hypothetical protein DUI87_21979 [Hirundo rustica rustica]
MAAGPGPWLLALALALWPADLFYKALMRDTQEGSKSFKFCSSCPTSSPSAVTDRGRDQEGLGLSAVPEAQAGQGWAEVLCRQREGGERPDRAVLAMWSALCVAFLPIVAVIGHVTLEQHPREVTVQEGNAVTFECSMERYAMRMYFMYWYRQGPSGSLKCIYIEGDIYGEGFQGHFVGSVESSRTTLQILSAKQRDAATYYCGARITLEQLCSRVDQKINRCGRQISALLSNSCSLELLSGTGSMESNPFLQELL